MGIWMRYVFFRIIVSKSLEASKNSTMFKLVNYYKPNCRRRTTKTKWIDEMKGLPVMLSMSMESSICEYSRSSSLSILLILNALGFRLPFASMTTTATTSLVFLHHQTIFCIALLKLVTHLHLMKFSCMHFTSIHFLPYFFGSPTPTISKWKKVEIFRWRH